MVSNDLQVVVGSDWTDRIVMEHNFIPTAHSPEFEALPQLVEERPGRCFSRSLVEVDSELARLPRFELEQHLAMVYPEALILYLRKDLTDLAEALEYGLMMAMEDGSFTELFQQQHAQLFTRLGFYDRKLLFLDNPKLTEQGREAINRYGVASFILPLPVEENGP